MTPRKDEFERLWRAGGAPPVWSERLADFDTPLSIFAALDDKKQPAFLLESVEGGEVWGRHSILACGVDETLVVEATRPGSWATVRRGKTWVDPKANDPIGALRETLNARTFRPRAIEKDLLAAAPPPPFRGGAVGWMSWDSVRHYAPIADVGVPARALDAVFLLPATWLVFDRLRSRVAIVADTAGARARGASASAAWTRATRAIAAIERKLDRASPPRRRAAKKIAFTRPPFDVDDAAYGARVTRAREYITAGDVIQVVLSRARSGRYTGDPMDVYRALRLINPSPYMFFFRSNGVTLAGSSPEALVRVQDRRVTTRPIAGTRPRGRNAEEDARLAAELLADEKERAEHVMLVDLGRNDLGRVAETGSVDVSSFMRVERYSHVMHLVSDVVAKLAEGKDALDAVASVFPAGTLSGAPKIRAMQIVTELENRPRGFYGGLLGWFGTDGNADTCIAIRSVRFDKDRFSVQAGAGIVFDSIPEKEAAETSAKAEGVMRALALAAKGLA